MAATKATPSGREACVAALAAADEAMTAGAIADAVLEAGVVKLHGKTPKATLTAQITSGAKGGQTFRKVGRGRPARFALRAGVEAEPELVRALKASVRRVARGS